MHVFVQKMKMEKNTHTYLFETCIDIELKGREKNKVHWSVDKDLCHHSQTVMALLFLMQKDVILILWKSTGLPKEFRLFWQIQYNGNLIYLLICGQEEKTGVACKTRNVCSRNSCKAVPLRVKQLAWQLSCATVDAGPPEPSHSSLNFSTIWTLELDRAWSSRAGNAGFLSLPARNRADDHSDWI